MGWTIQSAFVGTGVATTTISVTLPATVLAGDALTASVSSTVDATIVSAPAGWTITASSRGAYKVADGTEDGTTVDFEVSAVGIHRIRGLRATPDEGTCEFVEAGTANDNDGSVSVTLSSMLGDLFLTAHCHTAGAATIGVPAGYTNGASNTAAPGTRLAYRFQTDGTPTVSFTSSDTTNTHYAVLLAMRDGVSASAPNHFFFGSH